MLSGVPSVKAVGFAMIRALSGAALSLFGASYFALKMPNVSLLWPVFFITCGAWIFAGVTAHPYSSTSFRELYLTFMVIGETSEKLRWQSKLYGRISWIFFALGFGWSLLGLFSLLPLEKPGFEFFGANRILGIGAGSALLMGTAALIRLVSAALWVLGRFRRA